MITVLFFAHLQEMAGTERITIEANEMTISTLKKKLAEEYQLKNLDQIMFAINEEYANEDDAIKAGDIVALIPPVSGG
ncbi:molybdopterin converting factor subunit 1 [Fredinandcohnia sp. 179-A 10B2 NHS]|uniref:molybdopterin converting factor subunit 1 n=1 Tax=Fredinandcohnia sp. 179-A 10B2 NHS TaxID=3235176 RepID=UPI0039A0EC65